MKNDFLAPYIPKSDFATEESDDDNGAMLWNTEVIHSMQWWIFYCAHFFLSLRIITENEEREKMKREREKKREERKTLKLSATKPYSVEMS